MKKNDTFELTIEDVSVNGEGIGHYDGMTFFVKGAIPGDRALCGVTKMKKTYGFARVIELLETSKDRVTPKCEMAGRCGGCQIMQMDYKAQLSMKEHLVREKLLRIGGFSMEKIDQVMEPIVGMETPYHYRNKAQYPVGCDKDGNLIMGFYGPHSHRIVESKQCYLGTEVNEKIRDIIKSTPGVIAYNEETKRGLLRHVLIRKGFFTGEVMVCLIVNAKDENSQVRKLCDLLIPKLAKVEGMISICVNFNDTFGNVILGKKTICVWGKEYICDTIGDVKFQISAPSFFQVNPYQTKKLYDKALEYASLKGEETVWDLYCGIGTISLFLAQKAKRVYGVEVVPEAIENAKENARINHMENAKFFVGKAEEVLPEFYSKGTIRGEKILDGEEDLKCPDVIVVDPPRKGCDEACLNTMVSMKPERIVYVSCDPATLARDLKYLCENGYDLQAVTPVDQFAHSMHVESCVLLERVSNTRPKAITLDVDMEDYYRIKGGGTND